MSIKKFYAVTSTSVYLITEERDAFSCPRFEKIALKGNSEIKLGKKLSGGCHVGILPDKIILYEPKIFKNGKIESPDVINRNLWGGGTSNIIALFTVKKDAMRCFRAPNKQLLDERWIEKTKATLRKIGYKHKTFVISYGLVKKLAF